MLMVSAQSLGDVAILRCQGRIVTGSEETILRSAVLSQASHRTLVLDVAAVAGVDAGGLGALLDLRAWACPKGIQLMLMNVPITIQRVLEVANLDRVFEICFERDLVDLSTPRAALADMVPRMKQVSYESPEP